MAKRRINYFSRGFLLIGLIVFMNACSKNLKPASISDGSALDYHAFMHQPANGVFGVQSFTSQYEQAISRSTFPGGAFEDANRNSLPGGPVSIGDIILHDSMVAPDGHQYGRDTVQGTPLFGSNVVFDINPDPGGQVTGANAHASLYAPSLIYINSPSFDGQISPGSTLTWNADPLNPRKVFIEIVYDPGYIVNTTLAANYPNRLTNSIAVPDNGSYTFQNADFNKLPRPSALSLLLTRANYGKVYSTDRTRSYLIYTYNEVEASFFFPGEDNN